MGGHFRQLGGQYRRCLAKARKTARDKDLSEPKHKEWNVEEQVVCVLACLERLG